MSVYDYKVKARDGSEVRLEKYRNKVLLIVNTAISCDFSNQYDELENLYEKFHNKGFEILDFPCNQFKEGSSSSIDEINKYCKIKYKSTHLWIFYYVFVKSIFLLYLILKKIHNLCGLFLSFVCSCNISS